MSPLSIFGARSFWLLATVLLVQIAKLFGYSLGDAEDLGNIIADAASVVLTAWVYYERWSPKRQLKIVGPLK